MNTTETETSVIGKPTEEAYGEFQRAYDHYNRALFDGILPPCLITLHRRRRTYGYFAHRRFVRVADEKTASDEIAMNPMYFVGRSVEEVLSTLAHEMAHVWQAHYGKASRSGYHNKQWAAKMDEIGLVPSDTGAPGGKRTGQRVSHYIQVEGPFWHATSELRATGFGISWADALALLRVPALRQKSSKSGRRVKYLCTGCCAAVWGRGALRLICGDCQQPMRLWI